MLGAIFQRRHKPALLRRQADAGFSRKAEFAYILIHLLFAELPADFAYADIAGVLDDACNIKPAVGMHDRGSRVWPRDRSRFRRKTCPRA